MFYCADRCGTLHFGRTPEEALREAAETNREIK